MNKLLTCLAVCLFCLGCGHKEKPMALIFDTDMAPDYDDLGALAMVHAYADSGYVDLLATVASNKCETAVPCIEIVNAYYGRGELPVGGPKGTAPTIGNVWHKIMWTEELPKRFAHRSASTSDAPDAVKVYRRVLSAQPDTSVTILTVGFLSNLRDLLRSGPDELSSLDGKELVRKKVKRLVTMGALFPQGLEFNIMQDAEASKVVCEQWPTPVTFCGAEIGSQVLTGEPFLSDTVSGNPVQEAYVMSLRQEGVNTHGSCDQTTVLAAVKGTDGYFATEMGTLTVNPDSSTTWVASEGGRHIRLLAEKPYAELAREIDRTMMHRPVK